MEEQAETFCRRAKENGAQWVQASIINFISRHKQRVQNKEITAGTLKNYYWAVKLFCDMNDLAMGINWKRISRGLPSVKKAAADRPPTLQEIRKLVEYPDRRIKPLVYVMCSSGIRIGAWEYLQWKHVTPISKGEYLLWIKQQQQQQQQRKEEQIKPVEIEGNDETIIAAKLLVYAGEPEEHYTFITAEAYHELKKWMDFRKSYGEVIIEEEGKSPPVMRDIWQTSNMKYGAKFSLASIPKPLRTDGITRLLNSALWEQGVRQPLPNGAKRHEFKTAHSFRKFFKTRAELGMKSICVEYLMDHNIGVAKSYWRPPEMEVLHEYLKAVDFLTINENRAALLQKQQSAEKEKEFEEMKTKVSAMEEALALITRSNDVRQDWQDHHDKLLIYNKDYCAAAKKAHEQQEREKQELAYWVMKDDKVGEEVDPEFEAEHPTRFVFTEDLLLREEEDDDRVLNQFSAGT